MAKAPTHLINFFNVLLAKAILRASLGFSVAAFDRVAVRHRNRAAYILKVLGSSSSERANVKNIAMTTGANSIGCQQLVGILTVFEALSPSEKKEYARAFAANSVLVGQGGIDVALHSTWQPGHVPPHYEP